MKKFIKKINSVCELAELLNVKPPCEHPIAGFSLDSRTLKPQEIYCALKGARVDGHNFLEEAKSKGASLALIERSYKGKCPLPYIAVDDVVASLQKIVKLLLQARTSRIIAVTGSVGKTTCKDFLAEFLKAKFSVGKSQGAANSQVGLPLTILNHTNGKEEWLVLEMGMTSPGQIKLLVEMAPPEIAIITQVALAHSENFSSLSEIAQTKAEIFSHPTTRLGLFPKEIPYYRELAQVGTCRKMYFSLFSNSADYYMSKEEIYHLGARVGNLSFPFEGSHLKHNFLAALAVSLQLGLTLGEIKSRLPFLALPDKRFQIIKKKGIVFVNDSYNASPLAVEGALKNLPKPKKGNRSIAVLGSMMELGKFSDCCHEEVALVALNTVDALFCLGKECLPMIQVWKNAQKKAHFFEDHATLTKALKEYLKEGDVVLLKGSKSKQMWQVLDEF